MSKFIPNKEKKDYGGQLKPKLKIKVQLQDQVHYLTEYDLAQMISDLNVKVMQLAEQNKAIMDAMSAATQGVDLDAKINERMSNEATINQPAPSTLKMPKLKKVKSNMDSDHIYPNKVDAPSITE